MWLKPEIPAGQIYETLATSATLMWGLKEAALMDPQLRMIADAMAAIAALDIPDDTEPLFGEDGVLEAERPA
jgi:hypothetical protein